MTKVAASKERINPFPVLSAQLSFGYVLWYYKPYILQAIINPDQAATKGS